MIDKNMCEFLIFSDIHFDKNHNKSTSTIGGFTTWTECQLDVMDQIFSDYGEEHGIYDVFFNGDLFEKKNYLPQDLYNIVWNTFEKYTSRGFNIYLNTGNHDYHSKSSSSLRPFSNIVNVVTKPKDIKIGKNLIRIIPYGMVDGNLGIDAYYDAQKILMIHEDIAELKYGASDFVSSSRYKQQMFEAFDIVFNGHIHKAQVLGNIYNLGDCMRKDFGELDRKYFYHYKNGIVKPIEIDCPEFILVPGFSEKVRTTIEEDDYNFYRIDIGAEELSDTIFNKYNVFPNIVKVKEKRIRIGKDLTEEEEMEKYIEIVETNLDSEKLLKFAEELR